MSGSSPRGRSLGPAHPERSRGALRGLPFSLVLITDWTMGEPALLAAVEAALRAGPGIAVQHRHPGVLGRQFLAEGEKLASLCAKSGAPLFVNGRLDVALALGAHLHLPSSGIPVADARTHLKDRWISVAVHDEAEAAAAEGADLALVSPVYAPGSKPGDTRPQLGPEGFAALAARLTMPAFALGGMTPERLAGLQHCAGAAVVSAVLRSTAPRDEAAAFVARTNVEGR